MKKIIVLIFALITLLSGCKETELFTETSSDTEVIIVSEQAEANLELTYKEILEPYFNSTIVYISNLSKERNIEERERIEDYLLTLYEVAYADVPEERRENALAHININTKKVKEIYNKYNDDYALILEEEEIQKWNKKAEEYPTATAVWLHLTEIMEYNDYVAAGILGNMMAECGGHTLRLNWSARNASGHYGLCQWSTGFTSVQGADLQGQLEFMITSFPSQINRWGDICYKDNFDHDDFMEMEDAEEAAYAFCVIYERPGPGSYDQRRANALKALEYFTN